MSKSRVLLAPEAREQAQTIDAWWRENRPSAPELFSSELAAAFSTLACAPNAGTPYPHELRGVRRLLLRATRYHVYYRVKRDDVLVVSIWSSISGSGPDLSRRAGS
jgi:plasmid stabilization system protein ParE